MHSRNFRNFFHALGSRIPEGFARERTAVTCEALRWQTKCACRDAGIEYRGEHVFRHTFATNCYYKGMDIKILSHLLGHADVNITYNVYIHLFGDGFEEMYEALCK